MEPHAETGIPDKVANLVLEDEKRSDLRSRITWIVLERIGCAILARYPCNFRGGHARSGLEHHHHM